MADRRYAKSLRMVRAAGDPSKLRDMSDADVIQALAALCQQDIRDPYLANVLAVEAINRTQRASTIVQTVAEALLSIGPDGRIWHANPAALDMLGVSAGEIRGQPYIDFVQFKERPGREGRGNDPLERTLRTGQRVSVIEGEMRSTRHTERPAIPIMAMTSPIELDGITEGAVIAFRDVTELVAAREETTRERRRLRAILDHLSEGIVFFGRHGEFEYSNEAAFALTGLSADSFGRTRFDLPIQLETPEGKPIPRSETPAYIVLHQRIPVRRFRCRITPPDRSIVYLEINASPIFDAEDQFIGMVSSFVDITTRLEEEQRNQQLASVVENSTDGIIHESLDGTILSWNRGAQRLLGFSPDEVVGKPATVLVPPERRAEFADVIQRVKAGEVVPPFDTVRRRRDGSMVDVNATISPVRDPIGRIHSVSATFRDVTERVRAERRLAEELERQRSLYELHPDVVFTVSADGVILELNPAAKAVAGYDPAELIGQSFAPLIHPEDAAGALADHGRTMNGSPTRRRIRLRLKDGSWAWFEVVGVPLVVHGKIVGATGIAKRLGSESV
ncbi:MAG: PAS domain-containing protein [Thermoplasmatota archaeon]